MFAPNLRLVRSARLPGLRALSWSGEWLYASRRYDLLRARVQNGSQPLEWQSIASFLPKIRRRLSAAHRLTSRLFRDGFHALAILPSGGIIAAIPGAIITLRPNDAEFRATHVITRGTRPLHIAAVPDGTVYWGEYFDNARRDEVHIYASTDSGVTWNVAYTFPKRAIRHLHNMVHDPWENCLWILTGDYGNECRILRASCDLSQVEAVLQGTQQARAVAAVPTKDGLYFSSDTPIEANYIYKLDRRGAVSRLAPINGSSIFGCRVGDYVFFSTMVEPSEVNHDRNVRIYGANVADQQWQDLASWKKDVWPMRFFQYGNAFLPDGENTTGYLALTTAATESDDGVTSLYFINP